MLTYILFLVGFVLLIKGGDFLVDGSASIAKKFGVSSLFIGLTIVAFGTSAPELVVNIFASVGGSNDLAIGNILGSNLSNILLILGITAMIYPLHISHGTTWKEIPLSFLAVIVVGVLANDALIDGRNFSVISQADGIILLSFFIIFIYYTFGISKVSGEKEENGVKQLPLLHAITMMIVGILGLTFGGKWIVDGAVHIATQFGVSESLIGLTIVAIGTSLPELTTSVVAALKKNADLAVGNVVGSNIFNLLWILGVSSTINPIPLKLSLNFDIITVGIATFALFILIFIGKKHTIQRWQGGVFLASYIAYIVYLVYRG